MTTTITRKLEFDAGHRVLGHEGKCRNLHGHRYVAEITIEAPSLDSLGRVVDFSVIKVELGQWIDTHWDHNMILHPEDPLRLVYGNHVLLSHGDPKKQRGKDIFPDKAPFVMPIEFPNPTAENMAMVLLIKARLLLPKMLKIVSVKLWETPNCCATVTVRDLNPTM